MDLTYDLASLSYFKLIIYGLYGRTELARVLTGVLCYLLDVASEVSKAFVLLPFSSVVREVDGGSWPRFLLA